MVNNLALDIGTAFIKYNAGKNYKIRNGFVKLAESAFILNMCKKMKIDYYKSEGYIYIIGDDGFEIAKELNQPFKRCMSEGRVNPNEPDSLLVLGFIIKSLLGDKTYDKIGGVISGPCIDENIDFTFHRSVLNELIPNAVLVEEGYACGLGLLESSDFTGIGISVGGGLVNVGLLYKGINTKSFSLRKAGDWVDTQSGRMANISIEKLVDIKERMDIMKVKTLEEKILATYIEFMFKNAFLEADKVMSKDLLGKELVIGISGGITEMKGLRDFVIDIGQKNFINIRVKDIIIGNQFSNVAGVHNYLQIGV